MVNLKDLDVNRFLTLMFKNILFLLLFAACVHKCVCHSAFVMIQVLLIVELSFEPSSNSSNNNDRRFQNNCSLCPPCASRV